MRYTSQPPGYLTFSLAMADSFGVGLDLGRRFAEAGVDLI